LAQDKGNGAVLWGLGDNQGSIRLVTDKDGNVVNEITYDAFGQVTAETNAGIEFRFGYTGREFDSETGNYYYRSRYYDSTVGRFISEDSIGFDGGDANLYRYVANSPTNYIDPFGYYRIGFVPSSRRLLQKEKVPTVLSQPFFNPYRPNSIPSGYPIPDYPNNRSNSEPYDYSRTCITAPGSTCTPSASNESVSEWAKEVIHILEKNSKKQDSEDSCPAVYPYNNPDDDDDATVRGYGVESQGNRRVIISERGKVTILDDQALFLNFGQRLDKDIEQ
jgi:RHS repeat-associated protein